MTKPDPTSKLSHLKGQANKQPSNAAMNVVRTLLSHDSDVVASTKTEGIETSLQMRVANVSLSLATTNNSLDKTEEERSVINAEVPANE
jgi:hypothetical protein